MKFKKGMTPWNKGKSWSEKVKRKLSLAQKIRFADPKNHPNFGKHPSKETLIKLSLSHMGQKGNWTDKKRLHMTGKKHWNYKEKPLYGTIHDWVGYHYGKANKCENPDCTYPRIDSKNRLLLKPRMFVWANITGTYKRDINDWRQLCQSCNLIHDRIFIPNACKNMHINENYKDKRTSINVNKIREIKVDRIVVK